MTDREKARGASHTHTHRGIGARTNERGSTTAVDNRRPSVQALKRFEVAKYVLSFAHTWKETTAKYVIARFPPSEDRLVELHKIIYDTHTHSFARTI